MRDILLLGTGFLTGFYAFLTWLAIASIKATRRIDGINDAPCLVCDHHSCICGE